MTSVQFVPPLLDPAHPDFASVRAKVAATLQAPAAASAPRRPRPAARPPAPGRRPRRARPLPAPDRPTSVAETRDVQAVCSAS